MAEETEYSDQLPRTHAAAPSGDWRRNFAANMQHIDRLYQSLPTLNVIRTTALVGAMLETQKQSQGDNESLREKLKSEWTVLEGENKKYVYGEVSLLALSDVLHRFCPHGGVFYDLGSGSGRAVFSAAINHPTFTKLVGVELLEGLHTIADRALGAYNEDIRPSLDDAVHAQHVSFQCADLLEYDWADADVVLLVSTCFPWELMAAIERRAAATLRPGTVCITLTKHFKGDAWETLGSYKRLHGWGPSWMHVHRLTRSVPEVAVA